MIDTNRKHKVITLCGSTRFKKEFLETWERLTLEGNIVIMVAPFWRWEHRDLAPEVLDMFQTMHFEKIDMADEVFIVNPGGYIGDSTKMEIEYAEKAGKPVSYLFPMKIDRKEEDQN